MPINVCRVLSRNIKRGRLYEHGDPDNICNQCGQGNAEFVGHWFTGGVVLSQFRCTNCGAPFSIERKPGAFDLDDPRAIRAMLPSDAWYRRIGLPDDD